MHALSDEQLMDLVKQENHAAFNIIMERWELGVRGFIAKFRLNFHDQEDCVQQTFTHIYVHAHKFNSSSKFKSWVLSIAANEAKSKLRWIKIRQLVTLKEYITDSDSFAHQTAEIKERLQSLNPELQVICQLKLDGYENQEIAQFLKLSLRSLERKLAEIRLVLTQK